MLYFDHAASSWPKPEQVIVKMADFLTENAANPGRGNYKMADNAGKAIYQTREKIAELFHIQNPNQVVFFSNTTQALNQAIKGFLTEGDHVITTVNEHNSVRRPLEYMRKTFGIEISYLESDLRGVLSLEQLKNQIKPNTRLIAISHASNVLGSIQPITEIGRIAKENNIVFLVDAAQTAGRLQIHVEEMNIDLLAFPGHKGLLGPQGIAGLYINPRIQLTPLIHGGTGKYSEDIDQPSQCPERYESGTLNTIGIIGLGEALNYIEKVGIETIQNHEWILVKNLLSGLSELGEITVYGPDINHERVAVVSFTVEGIDSNEIGMVLDQHYDIAVRSGFHCAPMLHRSIGTINGAIRVSFGYTNTKEEVERFLSSMKEIISMMK